MKSILQIFTFLFIANATGVSDDGDVNNNRMAEIVECGTRPCLNGGTCSKDGSGYICTCLDGYLGDHCQTEKLPSSSTDNVPMTSAAQMITRPEASATTFSPISNSFPSLPIKILSTTQGKLKMTSSSEISSDEQAKLPSLSNTMHPFLTPKLKIYSLKRSSDVHTESTPFSSNMQPFLKGTLKITACKGSRNGQMESAPLSSTVQPLLSLINLTGSRGLQSSTVTPSLLMNSLSKPSNEANKSKRQSIAIEKGSPSIQGLQSSTVTPLLLVNSLFKPSTEISNDKPPSQALEKVYPSTQGVTFSTSISIPSTGKQENCFSCITMKNGSCRSYCVYVDKNYHGVEKCLCEDIDTLGLPKVEILSESKQPFTEETDVMKRDEERMFQASITRHEHELLKTPLSLAWFVRDVNVTPFAISKNRTLVNRGSLIWNAPAGSLSTGLKLIEFEVSHLNSTAARRDLTFIKVEEPCLIAVINGGSETLVSARGHIDINGGDSIDPGIAGARSSGMKFKWECFDGGSLVPIYNDTRAIVVPSESSKRTASICQSHELNETRGFKILFRPKAEHIYYILLVVEKDSRQAEFLQTVYAVDEDMLNVKIRCVSNCKREVIPSERFSLTAKCSGLCRLKNTSITWKLFTKGFQSNESTTVWHLKDSLKAMISTKISSRNIVFRQGRLLEGSSYRLTVNVQLPDGKYGWAAYQFKTVSAPIGGTCNGTQAGGETLGILLNIHCTGYNDKNKHLTYEFFHQVEGGNFHLLLYSAIPFVTVQIPKFDSGEVDIKVVIINSFAARAETSFRIQVTNPSWTNFPVGAPLFFRRAEASFTRYLKEGSLNDAWQIAQVLMQAVITNEDAHWITKSYEKNISDHIFQKLSNSNASDVQTVLQLSSVLNLTTSNPKHLSSATMHIGLEILEKWVQLIDIRFRGGNGKDRALNRDAWHLVLHCSGNILHAITRRVSSSTDERGKLERMQRRALDLQESMMNSIMSSRLTGEEYSVMKTKHNTVILGKLDIHEMSDLRVEDDKASFSLPVMDEGMTKKLFGNAEDVQFQMISYAVNPYSLHQPVDEINSEVLSLTLKDDNGNVMNISDLGSEISLKIPISEKGENETPSVDEYSVPDFMLYRDFTESYGNSKIKLSLDLQRSAPFELYVKYGAKPTKEDYDFATTLDKENCQDKTSICANISHHVWFDAERKGKYYIGLLHKGISTRKRRSTLTVDPPEKGLQLGQILKKRMPRSNSQSTHSVEELCVKFKDPPIDETTGKGTMDSPPYDPQKSVNFTVVLDSVGCRYWSESNQQWLNDGCKAGINSTATTLQCLCNHLTSFGGYFVVTPNKIDFDKVVLFSSDDPKDYVVIMTVSMVFLVYFIVLVFARRADKRDLEKVGPLVHIQSPGGFYRYKVSITTGTWRNSGTSANVSIKMMGTESSSSVIGLSCNYEESRKPFERGNTDNFLIAINRPIGTLIKVTIGHDSFGEDPSWFLNNIFITDLQLNCTWTFPCFRWLGLELEDGKTTLELYAATANRYYDFTTQFNNAKNYMFANEHMWFSIVTKDPKDVFTRVERVTCCCFFLLWGMIVSALFYQGTIDETRPIQIGPFKITIRELSVSVITAVIAFVPSYLVVFLFRKSRRSRVAVDGDYYRDRDHDTSESFQLPHLCIYIAWLICVAGSVLSSVFMIFYSLVWKGDKSSRWLASVFLTSTEDIFISQPLKIVVISVILALLFPRKRIQTHDLASSTGSFQSDGNSKLFSITKKEIEEQRKFRITEMKTNLFARNIVFSIVFHVLLLIVCYGNRSGERFHLAEATRNAFTNLSQVKNTSGLWKWLDDVVIPVVYAGEWYNGQKEPMTVYTGNKLSILLGMPRLRQLRIKKGSCSVPSVLGNWVSSCYDFYSKEKEDKEGWDLMSNNSSIPWKSVACPENWKYMSEDDVGDYSSHGVHSVYGSGGYVANLGYLDYTARRILRDLAKNEWIDRQTRVVLIEVTMFNVATNQLLDVVLYFEMIPSGYLGSFLRIEVIRMAMSDSYSTTMYLIIRLLFAFFLGYYSVTECIRAYRLKCAYLKSPWSWLEMLQILSAVSAVFISIEKEKHITQALEKLSKNPFAIVSFHDALFWFQIENHVICMAVTIATLRFLRLLKFNRQIIILFLSVKKSVKPILSYAVVFCIVFTAFAHAGSLLFGKSIYMFSSFKRVIVQQLLMALGASAPRRELVDVHSDFARLYIESFLFFTVVLLINFFVAILNDVHSESTSANKGNEDMEVASRLLSKFLKMFGITKGQQEVSPKTKVGEDVREKKQTRQMSISDTNSSPSQKEKTEASKERNASLTDFDTSTQAKTLKQRQPALPTANASPVSKVSSQENKEKKEEFVCSPLTYRKEPISTNLESLIPTSSGNLSDNDDELHFSVRRTVHFADNVQIRKVSASSNDFIASSIYSRSLSNKQEREKGSTSKATVNSTKRVLINTTDEIHGTPTHSCDISQEVYEKPKDKIINFDDVSKWLKRIDPSSNTSRNISEFQSKMSSNPKHVAGTVDFDILSKILKLKEKAKKLRGTAGERITKELIRQAKRLDQLLYLLDQSEGI